MKLKLTPLFIISVGLLLYSLYLLFFSERDIQGYWQLEWMMITGFSVGLFIVYIIFRALFKSRVWIQSGVEIVLLGTALIYYYKTEGEFLFSLPKYYKGHVLVVYNVKGQPELPTTFFSNKVKLAIPSSGIILTSSLPLNKKYYFGGTFTEGSKNINDLQGANRRHDLPLDSDTVMCNGKKYPYHIWIIKDKPNWSKRDDSLYGLDNKLQMVCELINRKATANSSFRNKG